MLPKALLAVSTSSSRRGSAPRRSFRQFQAAVWPVSSAAALVSRKPCPSPPARAPCEAFRKPWQIAPARRAHTGAVYINHVIPGAARNSAAITIGILHALQRLIPGIGYFRPIDVTTIGGNRAQLMKDIYHLDDSVESMQGVTQQRGLEMFTQNKYDDMMEEIFKAYDGLKQKHDCMVIEGTNLRGFGGDIVSLNAKMASMLGASALLAVDARGVVPDSRKKRKADDCQQEIIQATKMNTLVYNAERVEVLSTIVHGLPAGVGKTQLLDDLLKQIQVPCSGIIPDEPLLHSINVQDVVTSLGAELLYDVKDYGIAMSIRVTDFIVATTELSHVLEIISSHSDPTTGAVVVCDASRSDILLGLLHLQGSKTFSNVAALVLTGGLKPKEQIDRLAGEQAVKGSLPVLLAPVSSFEAAAMLSRVESAIQGTSLRKIERAQLVFEDHVNIEGVAKAILQERPISMNPKLFQHNLFNQAKKDKQRIVLPEVFFFLLCMHFGTEQQDLSASSILVSSRGEMCHGHSLHRREWNQGPSQLLQLR